MFSDAALTGNRIPAPINVEDTSQVAAQGVMTPQQVNAKRVTKKKFFKTTTRKKDAVREDLGHLPPEQRRKALHKKVQELEKEETVQQRTLAGLENAIDLYTKQPEMGTDKAVKEAKKEAAESRAKLQQLEADLFKFKLYLSALEGTDAPSTPSALVAPPVEGELEYDSFASGTEEEEEEAEVTAGGAHGEQPQPGAPPPPRPAPPPQQASTPTAEVLYDFEGVNEGELAVKAVSARGFVPLQTCGLWLAPFATHRTLQAGPHTPHPTLHTPHNTQHTPIHAPCTSRLTPHAATSTMPQGDRVAVLENDGSGWVRVNFQGQEGYVPESYVQL